MIRKIISLMAIVLVVVTIVGVSSYKTYGADTLDSVMKGADEFVKGGGDAAIDKTKLQDTSKFMFNALLGIAMVIAVVVGMIIGIQFMIASVEDKAKIKEALVPYVAGCFVVFGAFGIWKLAVTILSAW